jgi:hypothetical protein
MYARRVAEAVELAKERARSIMNGDAEPVSAPRAMAGAKPKAATRRERAGAPAGGAGKKSRDA